MDTKALLRTLRNISFLLEVKGENPFKSRAYTTAADIIEEQCLDPEALVVSNTLGEVKGFGKALVTKITEYAETGKISYFEKLKQEIPESIIELVAIPGLGTKKISQLYKELKVTGIESLEAACKDNSVSALKGFGPKSAEAILNGIKQIRATKI